MRVAMLYCPYKENPQSAFASEINLIVPITLILQLLALALAVLLDPYIEKKQRRLLLINAALIASLIAEDIRNDFGCPSACETSASASKRRAAARLQPKASSIKERPSRSAFRRLESGLFVGHLLDNT